MILRYPDNYLDNYVEEVLNYIRALILNDREDEILKDSYKVLRK